MVRAEEGAAVPVLLFARPPLDAAEAHTIRKLAGARHAPGDWIRRARMIVCSWDGLRTTQIADQLGCHPQTVRERLHRCNAEGVGGLGARPARGGGTLDPGHPGRARPGAGRPGGPQPGPPHPVGRRGALATDPLVDAKHRPRLRPKSAQVIARSTEPPEQTTVRCADELGPVIPRSFPPAPGWSPDGHRVKAMLDYGRGPEKTWVDGGLRVGDGHEVTMTAPSRNRVNDQRFLGLVEQANPTGIIVVGTDNLSSHPSASTRTWLLDHPRIQHTPSSP